MAYQQQPNPYVVDGRIIPGKEAEAFAWGKQEYHKYLDSLSPEERREVERGRRQLADHMNVSVS